MRRTTIRSPGTATKRGKRRDGVLSREILHPETEAELVATVRMMTEEHEPLWREQIRSFADLAGRVLEKHGHPGGYLDYCAELNRDMTAYAVDHKLKAPISWSKFPPDIRDRAARLVPTVEQSGQITAPQYAVKALELCRTLKIKIERQDGAETIAETALELAGKMIELVMLANEATLLIGAGQQANNRKRTRAAAQAKRAQVAERNAAILVEAARWWKIDRKLTAQSVARRVKIALNMTLSIGRIRVLLKK